MKIIKEDLDLIIPSVIDAVDVTEITPEGPAQGLDTAVADLILNSINTSTQKLQEYNTLNANLGNHEDLRDILTEIMADENNILGKLQTMLKVVSPNAAEIMNGAVEAEEQISESFIDKFKKKNDYYVSKANRKNDYYTRTPKASEMIKFNDFSKVPDDLVGTYISDDVFYSDKTDTYYKYVGKKK